MEEKKKTTVSKKEPQPKKLTYEQLENAAKQLSVQFDAVIKENNQLKIALQKSQLADVYAQLDFMFKVLKYAEMFDVEFVDRCVKNIQSTMTPEETKDNEE